MEDGRADEGCILGKIGFFINRSKEKGDGIMKGKLMITVMIGLLFLSPSIIKAEKGGMPVCTNNLGICTTDLELCTTDLAEVQIDFATCQETLAQCNQKAPSPVARTGQTVVYRPGDDGALQKGVPWPDPRFVDNGDGTVTDNLTRLVWMKRPTNQLGVLDENGCFRHAESWDDAMTKCDTLFASSDPSVCICKDHDGNCNLTDGSESGDWRLPNVRELLSLVDYSRHAYQLPSELFEILDPACWTSTTRSYYQITDYAWYVEFDSGDTGYALKTESLPRKYSWCVRDPK